MTGLLILGGGGRLAQAVGRERPDATLALRQTLDLTDFDAIGPALDRLRPAAVLNAAAIADVERCEREPDLAHAVNALGPGRLAEQCAARGIPLIHISTDYVFSGRRGDLPAVETDETAPVGAYATSKATGEALVLRAGASACVVRVAWLFGHPADFLHDMLRRADQALPLRVFRQVGSPTPLGPAAERLGLLMDMMVEGRPVPPILHVCGSPPASRSEWLDIALSAYCARRGRPRPAIEEVPPAAPRPAFSALDARLGAELLGNQLDWSITTHSIGDGFGEPAPVDLGAILG